MYVPVTSARPLHNSRILLAFNSDEWRVLDIKPYMNDTLFAELNDQLLFRSMRVGFDKVEWRNGATLSSEVLYNDSIRVERNYDDEDYS